MSITGNGRESSAPVRWGNPIGGIAGALYAVVGILASLVRRQQSGQGAWLDVALFDAQLALHAYRVPTAMSGRQYAADAHRGGSGALPYGPFLARDGKWFVLAITHQFWGKACDAMGHPEWALDPRFTTEVLRQDNEVALNALVRQAMRTQDADIWQERFVKQGIPGATVLTIREAFDHPQARHREMLAGFDAHNPVAQQVRVAGNPIRVVGQVPAAFKPVPGLGEGTCEVLQTLLQIGTTELNALREQRAVWWSTAGIVYERPSVV